jgi:hypothetical protein
VGRGDHRLVAQPARGEEPRVTAVGRAEHAAATRARARVVAALGAIVVAALLVGDPATPAAPAAPGRAADAAAVPAGGARSVAWLCPGAPVLEGVESSLHVANFGARDATADVVALVDGGAPVRRAVRVPARSVVRVARRTLTPLPGAFVVEAFSSEVVVEESLRGDGAATVGPCATQGSERWYFAGATTTRGIEDWLVLLNPFTDDAVVDVTLLTDTGVQRPLALQAVDVPAGARVVLPVHEAALRQPEVAAVVRTRAGGRVVAAQLLRFGAASGRRGVARGLGVTTLGETWLLADGDGRRGAVRDIAVANPGDVDSEVDVRVVAEGDVAIEPRTIGIPARSLVTLRIGGCGGESTPTCLPMPDGVEYGLVVATTLAVPVVVGDLLTATGADAGGASADLATRRAATEWRFARGAFTAQRSAHLSVMNPGADVVHASVSVVAEGSERPLAGAQELEIAPGGTVRVPLEPVGDTPSALLVASDRPVVVERVVVQPDDVTRSAGIPRR